MGTVSSEKWLADTRLFWDVESEFDARYRRICASEEFLATQDEEKLAQLWEQQTRTAMALILEGVPLRPDWVCLEIGSGMGRLLKPLAGACRRAVGVDVCENMVAHSRKYLAEVENACVHLNDGRSLPMIADRSVDFVYSHLAFQHLTLYEVVEDYLAEIARVLKPGGYLRVQVMQEPAPPPVEWLKDLVRPLLGREKYHSTRFWQWREGKRVEFGGVTFRPRQWRNLLAAHGFKTPVTQQGLGHECWMWTTSVRRG